MYSNMENKFLFDFTQNHLITNLSNIPSYIGNRLIENKQCILQSNFDMIRLRDKWCVIIIKKNPNPYQRYDYICKYIEK